MQVLYICAACASCGMTCGLLMIFEDARGDHIDETYSRSGLITAMYVAMRVSFCLQHVVAILL